jgi:hypothetical protein
MKEQVQKILFEQSAFTKKKYNMSCINESDIFEVAEKIVKLFQQAAVSNRYSAWIPVKDKLPTRDDGDINGNILVINEDSREQEILDYDAIARYAELYKYVTHWQRLPVFRA